MFWRRPKTTASLLLILDREHYVLVPIFGPMSTLKPIVKVRNSRVNVNGVDFFWTKLENNFYTEFDGCELLLITGKSKCPITPII